MFNWNRANRQHTAFSDRLSHSSEEVTHQFDVNVVGMGRAVAAVLPYMRKQGSGNIAITSSAAGHVSMPGMAWYPATEHAPQGFADGLRMGVKEFGIKVALIEPGYIDTDIDNASLPYLDHALEQSGAEAYREQITNFRKRSSEGVDNGASPDTIAKVAVKALTSDSPKRRYRANADARAAVFMKRFVATPPSTAFSPHNRSGSHDPSTRRRDRDSG